VTTDVDSPAATPAQRTRARDLLPFGWERPPGAAGGPGEPDALFRFPAADDPDPGTFRVLGMALYAAALGLAGVGVGLRSFVSVLGGGVPGWYVPVLALAGLVSVALAIGAFLSVHRPLLPWLLLFAAAVPLAGDIAVAVAY
jgi:hypothetical protein